MQGEIIVTAQIITSGESRRDESQPSCSLFFLVWRKSDRGELFIKNNPECQEEGVCSIVCAHDRTKVEPLKYSIVHGLMDFRAFMP